MEEQLCSLESRVATLEKALKLSTTKAVRKPRKESAYNIFMRTTMKELKESGVAPKELMSKAAEKWREQKVPK